MAAKKCKMHKRKAEEVQESFDNHHAQPVERMIPFNPSTISSLSYIGLFAVIL
jgi:hypothetical protein